MTTEENLDVELINGSFAVLTVINMPKNSVIPDISRWVKSSKSWSNIKSPDHDTI